MNIAVCTDQYVPMLSGLVDSVETLAIALRKRGHTVRIYAPMLPGAEADADVFRFPAIAIPGSDLLINFPVGAMKDMRAFKPDIIHTHLFGVAGFLAWYAARRLSVPLVGTDHTFPADYLHYLKLNFWPFPYLVRRYASWFYSRCDFVTVPSERMLEELRTHDMWGPAKIISNPIPEVFRPLEHKSALKQKLGIGPRAIAIFGRLAVEKNLDTALDIFADVAKRSDAELIFIGSGVYREAFEARVKNLGLVSRVKFLGLLRGEKLVEAINACDALLITSLSENQPMTLLQAMACGLPIVAARAGGLPEYVRDGITGYTVDADKLHECGDYIVRLLNDSALANNLGEAGHKAIAPYSPDTIAQEFEEVYKNARVL